MSEGREVSTAAGIRRLLRDWSYTVWTTVIGMAITVVALVEASYALAGLSGAASAFGLVMLWRRWRHPEIRPWSERINRR